MKDRRGSAAVAFAAAIVISTASLADSSSTPTTFVTLAGSPQLMLSHAATARSETFPLAVLPAAGVDVSKLAASVIALTRDGSIQALPNAVVATLDIATGAPRLQLTVDFTRLFVPGTYEATILISRQTSAVVPTAGASAGKAGSGAGNAGAGNAGAGNAAAGSAAAGNAAAGSAAAGSVAAGSAAAAAGNPAAGAAAAAGNAAAGAAAAAAAGNAAVAAPAGEPQRLTLRLIVPAATLRPLDPILVERELSLFGDAAISQPTITLRETSALSPLRLSASQDGALTADDHLVSSQITLGDLPAIDPGMAGTATLTLRGRFPIGTTRGNLLLTAPELVTPFVVPVEIRTRRASWLVPLLFLVGAAVGFLWRTLLASRRVSLAAELAASELRARIVAFLDTQPRDWATDLIALRDALDALDARTAATVTQAEAALKTALELRAAHVHNLVQRVQAGLVATRSPWRLPMGLDLLEGATHYGAAYEQLQHRAFGDAIARGQRGASAVDTVLDRCRSWASELARVLGRVKDGVPGCPWPAHASVDAAVAAAITALAAAEAAMASPQIELAALTAEAALASAQAAITRLQAMHAAARAAGELAKTLAEALDQARRSMPATLAPTVAADLMSAATLPSRPSDRAEEAIKDGLAACARLAEIAAAAAHAIYPRELPDAVSAALADGKYVEALAPRPAAPPQGDGRGAPVAARLAAPTPPPASMLAPPGAPSRRAAAVATAVIMPLDTAAPAPVTAARTAQQLHAALDHVAWLRWAIGAAVTSAAAWVLYGEAFVGTGVEMFAVFAAGFLTDLTTDTAIEGLLGKLKPPAPRLAAGATGAPG